MSELEAFRSADFDWTRQLRSVWKDPPYHVAPLHQARIDDLVDYFARKTDAPDPTDEPLGRVIVGPAGYGKTHLIGELRRRIWNTGGWFVLLDFVGIKDFWFSVALGFLTSLQVRMPDGRSQYDHVVGKLAATLGIEALMADVAEKRRTEPRRLVTELSQLFVGSLSRLDRQSAVAHRDVMVALINLISDDIDCHSIAHAWLQGMDLDPADTRPLGFVGQNDPMKVVQGLCWIMSLAGPTLIAVDQIDAIVSASNAASRTNGNGATQEQEEAQSIVEALANGLIDLHEKKRRAVTVISCLEATWRVLQDKTVVSVTDRYSSPAILHALPSGDIAKGLVAARLSKAYASAGFEPPYPTWPFTESAFESAVGFSPRQLLKACEQHRQNCIASGEVTECETFAPAEELPKPKPVVDNELDLILAAEFDMASADSLLDAENEDRLQELLDPTLRLLEKHFDLPEDIDSVAQPDSEQKRPALHGRLTFIFRNEGDREQHYCFRGLSHTNANAFQSRLKAAMTASGIDQALGFRHLFILRRGAPPGGAKTKQLIDQFTAAGGRFIVPTEDDLRGMIALREMAGRDLPNFDAWLRARRPLFDSGLLQAAGLCPPPFLRDIPAAQSSSVAEPVTAAVAPVKLDETPPPAANPAKGNGKVQELAKAISRSVARVLESPFLPRSVPIGRRFDSGIYGDAVRLDANLLSRHMAILAGTGSGKTVLLRRIVEEAALLKLPAIVLDINNDLARLGEMWPVPPEGFSDLDASKAADYHSRTEVVVWTPGVSSGNPISLNLLPDFAAIGDKQDSQTEDERSQAVEMARATIGPYVGGGGQKAQLRQGVLADVLRVFARGGGGTLDDLIALLSELPEEASRISDAPKLASEIANQLLAAVATNPLLQSAGQPLDPHYLFHGDKDKTRISVINLSGLASEEARQAFVNQLQMTLFTWIKRHPSPTGRLYVLDEAQNFAPSQLVTACKRSALSLVAQARKYGLGMIFATQLPKGIDNAIVSNCTTHVYGRMSAPATIQATMELMAAKGGAADDLARLTRGEFYFSTEGFLKPLKVRTPLCLSWHPPNPPTAEEVIQRARAKRSNVVAASRTTLETAEQQLPLFAIGDRDIEAVQGD